MEKPDIVESEYYLAARTGNHRICFFTSCANDKKSDTLVCCRLYNDESISKFTCAMVVSFSPLDNNIIVISMLWELLLGML